MTVGKKPRKPIPRYTEMPRSGRLRPKKRSAAERERIYGTEAHQKWLRSHRCLVCERSPVELAHTANGGMGRKADAKTIVPLCNPHHRSVHNLGVRGFESLYRDELLNRTLASWAETFADAWSKRA